MVKNDFVAECLDGVLTTDKMHKILLLQINISRITLFIYKKKQRKNTKVQLSQNMIFTKKASLKIYQSPQFSRYLYKILTAGSLDHFYVKLVCDLRNFNFLIFNHIFSKFLRKNLEKIRLKIKK